MARGWIVVALSFALVALSGCSAADMDGVVDGVAPPPVGNYPEVKPPELGLDADTDYADQFSVPRVLNGVQTSERPEIGALKLGGGLCTGTLIRHNVVITAAHCVSFRSQEGNQGWTFEVTTESGQIRPFPIDGVYSYPESGDNGRDLALLRLSTSVPQDVAIPSVMATSEATPGEQVAIYGYGCTDRGSRQGTQIKRKFTYAYGTSHNLCPGDSGGPVVTANGGPVFHINSAYYIHNGEDLFGKPYEHRQDLLNKIQEWNGTSEPDPNSGDGGNEPEPGDVPGVSVTNMTGTKLWVHCGKADASATCADWTLIENSDNAFIATPDGSLYLYNVDFNPSVTFNRDKVVVDGESATIYPNASNPLVEPSGNDPQPEPEPAGTIDVTNATGFPLWVHCGGQPSANCDAWQKVQNGSAVTVKSPTNAIYLYNVKSGAPIIYNIRRVATPSPEVTVYLNTIDPLAPGDGGGAQPEPNPNERDPLPDGRVEVTNQTGTQLYVHCDGPTSATCSDWTLIQPGAKAIILTDNRGLLLHNSDFDPAVEYYVRQVYAPQTRVTIYANSSNPFAAP